jgi:hypothetical protein
MRKTKSWTKKSGRAFEFTKMERKGKLKKQDVYRKRTISVNVEPDASCTHYVSASSPSPFPGWWHYKYYCVSLLLNLHAINAIPKVSCRAIVI